MPETVVIHRDFTIADVDPRLYGVHLGGPDGADHAVLTDAAHPAAEDGLRTDVLDLARAFRVPCMLGSAPSPDPARLAGPIVVDGLVDLCRRAEAEPMLRVPVRLAAGRGAADPTRRVRMWRLDLEGTAAGEAASAAECLRAADPSATVVLGADGAGAGFAETLGRRHCRSIDLLSLPSADLRGDAARVAASVDEAGRLVDRHRLVDRCGRSLGLQVDRWGDDGLPAGPEASVRRAMTMNALIRRADRVRTAFAAGVLVGLADLLSGRIGMGPAVRGHDPVLAGSVYGRGVSLMPARRGPEREDAVDVAAVRGDDGRSLTLFLANPATGEQELEADLRGFAGYAVREYRIADPLPRLPGTGRPVPAMDGGRLRLALPALGYGLVRLALPSS